MMFRWSRKCQMEVLGLVFAIAPQASTQTLARVATTLDLSGKERFGVVIAGAVVIHKVQEVFRIFASDASKATKPRGLFHAELSLAF